ncbi:MAG: hypothetical protein ACLS59_06705 [Clostridia bacterium]|jgi:hypothetical protein
MKLIIQRDFILDGVYYFENDEIEPDKIGTIKDIARLNENGFIKPLSLKELIKLESEMKQPKNINKEEEK